MKFLTGWLQEWRGREFQISDDLIDCDTREKQDNDYICSKGDSDSGSESEENRLNNVLLVTGPVGVTTETAPSTKTCIHACLMV